MIDDPIGLDLPGEDDPMVRALRGSLSREADRAKPSLDGLHRIRSEIEARKQAATRLRRRRLSGLAVAAAAVLVVAGVATAMDRFHRAPATPADRATSTPIPAGPGLPIYYSGRLWQLDRLFREFHQATTGGGTDIAVRVQAAVTQALSERPDDPDYQTLWPAGATARTSVTPDLITIELSRAVAGGIALDPGTLPVEGRTIDQTDVDNAALQQLIWTATAAAAPGGVAGPVRVLIRIDGPVPNRFGSIRLDQPFRRGNQPGDHDPRALVWIDSLGQDSGVPVGPLTVTGQSTGASLPLTWTLQRAGKTIDTGSITPVAADGGQLGPGLRGMWTARLDLPTVGRYRFRVVLDVDDGGGGVDSKDFVVTKPGG